VTSPAEVLPEKTGVGGDVQVSCRDVWKVFGPHAEKVIVAATPICRERS